MRHIVSIAVEGVVDATATAVGMEDVMSETAAAPDYEADKWAKVFLDTFGGPFGSAVARDPGKTRLSRKASIIVMFGARIPDDMPASAFRDGILIAFEKAIMSNPKLRSISRSFHVEECVFDYATRSRGEQLVCVATVEVDFAHIADSPETPILHA